LTARNTNAHFGKITFSLTPSDCVETDMSRAFTMLLAAAFLVSAPGHTTPQTQAIVTLPELRYLVRPLLIFAPKPDDPQLEIQIRTVEEHAVQAHDLLLLPIGLPYQNAPPTPAKFTDAEAESLRRRFSVAPTDFAVILLDKQGSMVSRSPKPLSIHELAQVIKETAEPIPHPVRSPYPM
jgi:hypothetical protein